jgi:hypothetical protein
MFFPYMFFSQIFLITTSQVFGAGVILAWRWLLTTAAIFSALVAINEIYVLWLEPPALYL